MATRAARKRCPIPGRNLSIPTPNSRIAFCVSPICPTMHSTELSRHEATLWRQVAQILFALDALDRRKPQERGRRFRLGSRPELPVNAGEDC